MAIMYQRQPVVEAICELRFPPDAPWDAAVPGIVYERLKEAYPTRRSRLFHSVATHIDGSAARHEVSAAEGVQLRSPDELDLVQVAPRLMSINRLRPYCGWEQLRPRIEAAIGALIEELSGVEHYHRIGLRYINSFTFPPGQVELSDYLDFHPHLGHRLPQDFSAFVLRVDLLAEGDAAGTQVTLRPAPPTEEGGLSIILDIDAHTTPSAPVPLGEAMGFVDMAHGLAKSVFEGCIKDTLRKRLGEVH